MARALALLGEVGTDVAAPHFYPDPAVARAGCKALFQRRSLTPAR